MIFDTDVFIWIQRGNKKAARLVDREEERLLSVQSYMELLQCAQDKRQHQLTRDFLRDFGFRVLPLSENIGHRAAIYIEQFTLSHNLRAGDALIAATAAELNLPLCTSNAKHYRFIEDIQLKTFKP
ncbi:type II toxin-antitoxin system VapC family toxin [Candidatus Sumerlaeota bacterium]|nr:type II toxin-antitoxin system VapC family toxin [Candidatus Sumerlaeota bacterium]